MINNYINYKKYINSSRWKNKSRIIKEEHPFCYCCGSVKRLAVHHICYHNLGCESDWDLKVLCDICHKKVHFTNTGKFINTYPRTYKRVKGLKRLHEKNKYARKNR